MDKFDRDVGLEPEEYRSVIHELREQLDDARQHSAELDAQVNEMMQQANDDAENWDRERGQLTELIQQTLERQKDFNEQLVTQRAAWDEMEQTKAALELENEELRRQSRDLEADLQRSAVPSRKDIVAERMAANDRFEQSSKALLADVKYERELRSRLELEIEGLRAKEFLHSRTAEGTVEQVLEAELSRARDDLMAMRGQLVASEQRCEHLQMDLSSGGGQEWMRSNGVERGNTTHRSKSAQRHRPGLSDQARPEENRLVSRDPVVDAPRSLVARIEEAMSVTKPSAADRLRDEDERAAAVQIYQRSLSREYHPLPVEGRGPLPVGGRGPLPVEGRGGGGGRSEAVVGWHHHVSEPKEMPSFEEIDRNHDGVIDKREWERAMKDEAGQEVDHGGAGNYKSPRHSSPRNSSPRRPSPHRRSHPSSPSVNKARPGSRQEQQARELESETKKALQAAKEMAMRRVGVDGGQFLYKKSPPPPSRPYTARPLDRTRQASPTSSRTSPSPRQGSNNRRHSPRRQHSPMREDRGYSTGNRR